MRAPRVLLKAILIAIQSSAMRDWARSALRAAWDAGDPKEETSSILALRQAFREMQDEQIYGVGAITLPIEVAEHLAKEILKEEDAPTRIGIKDVAALSRSMFQTPKVEAWFRRQIQRARAHGAPVVLTKDILKGLLDSGLDEIQRAQILGESFENKNPKDVQHILSQVFVDGKWKPVDAVIPPDPKRPLGDFLRQGGHLWVVGSAEDEVSLEKKGYRPKRVVVEVWSARNDEFRTGKCLRGPAWFKPRERSAYQCMVKEGGRGYDFSESWRLFSIDQRSWAKARCEQVITSRPLDARWPVQDHAKSNEKAFFEPTIMYLSPLAKATLLLFEEIAPVWASRLCIEGRDVSDFRQPAFQISMALSIFEPQIEVHVTDKDMDDAFERAWLLLVNRMINAEQSLPPTETPMSLFMHYMLRCGTRSVYPSRDVFPNPRQAIDHMLQSKWIETKPVLGYDDKLWEVGEPYDRAELLEHVPRFDDSPMSPYRVAAGITTHLDVKVYRATCKGLAGFVVRMPDNASEAEHRVFDVGGESLAQVLSWFVRGLRFWSVESLGWDLVSVENLDLPNLGAHLALLRICGKLSC